MAIPVPAKETEMSKVVRTYSRDEIMDILGAHARQEYLDGKIELVANNGKVRTSGRLAISSNNLATLRFEYIDDNEWN